MEAIGGAAAIISIGEAVKVISDFWISVQDAPAEVAEILKRLQIIDTITGELANDVRFHHKLDAAACKVLQNCRDSLSSLEGLLYDFDVKSTSRTRRKWNAIKVVFKKEKIEKFQIVLEQTKSSLILLVQIKSERETRSDLALITSNVDNVRDQLSNTINTTICVHTEIKDVKTHVQEIQKEVQGMAQMFEQNSGVPKIAAEFESLMSTLLAKAMTSTEMRNAVESIIAANAQQNQQMHSTRHLSIPGEEIVTASTERTESVQVRELTRSHSEGEITTRRVRERHIIQRHYESTVTPIGTLHYYTKIMSVQAIRPAVRDDHVREPLVLHEIETSFTILPAQWLLKYGATALFKKSPRSFDYNISYFPIVPQNAMVMEFCRDGNLAGIQSLFDRKMASPLDTDPSGLTLLHIAAAAGNIDICSFLLERGANVNTVDYQYHHTAAHKLMWYPQQDKKTRLQVSRLMVEYGADFSVEDYQGWTPYTIGTSNLLASDAHEWLLRQGSGIDFDPSRRDVGGFTTLHAFMSAAGGHEIIDLLLRLGSDVNQTLEPPARSTYDFYRGRTAVHFLTYRALTGRVLKRWPSKAHFKDIARVLFQYGGDPHLLTGQNYSPTMIAMREREAFCWWRESLVEAGFDLDEFVDRECEVGSKMVKQGWNGESLRRLFHYSFPPPSFFQDMSFAEQQSWWKAQVESLYPTTGTPDSGGPLPSPVPYHLLMTRKTSSSNLAWQSTAYRLALTHDSPHPSLQLSFFRAYVFCSPASVSSSSSSSSSTTTTPSPSTISAPPSRDRSQRIIRHVDRGGMRAVLVRLPSITVVIVSGSVSDKFQWRMVDEVDDYEHVNETAFLLAEPCELGELAVDEAKRRWFFDRERPVVVV